MRSRFLLPRVGMILVTAFRGAQPMTDYQPAPPSAVVLSTQDLRLEIGADGLVKWEP